MSSVEAVDDHYENHFGGKPDLMISLDLRWTTELTNYDYEDLAALFDSEYEEGWGKWSPKTGYGYARGELHALARSRGQLLGYAATARRFIGVGRKEVLVAGTGGVITRKDSRGTGVGRQVLAALQEANREFAPADFGFLGCREAVVPFYEACGYARLHKLTKDVSPQDAMTVIRSNGPTMICAGTKPISSWPDGTIDLRGLPW